MGLRHLRGWGTAPLAASSSCIWTALQPKQPTCRGWLAAAGFCEEDLNSPRQRIRPNTSEKMPLRRPTSCMLSFCSSQRRERARVLPNISPHTPRGSPARATESLPAANKERVSVRARSRNSCMPVSNACSDHDHYGWCIAGSARVQAIPQGSVKQHGLL